MQHRSSALAVAVVLVTAAVGCEPVAPSAPAFAPPTTPAPPELDVGVALGDALSHAIQVAYAVPSLAGAVGLVAGDQASMSALIAAGTFDDVAAAAAGAVSACEGASAETVAGGRALVIAMPSPCALPSGVTVSGVVTASFVDGDRVQVDLMRVLGRDSEPGFAWRGFVELSNNFFPLGTAADPIAADASAIFAAGADTSIGVDENGAGTIDVQNFAVGEPAPASLGLGDVRGGPVTFAGEACSVLGSSIFIEGLEKAGADCAAGVASLSVVLDLRCAAADGTTSAPSITAKIAPLVAGDVDATVDIQPVAPAGSPSTVRLTVPAAACQ